MSVAPSEILAKVKEVNEMIAEAVNQGLMVIVKNGEDHHLMINRHPTPTIVVEIYKRLP